jgi:5-formyltetrahydrofolate cyclo-ligase
LEVCPYRIGDNLKKSEFGVLEPLSDNVDAKILDLVIVPALMADKMGYRLGYGGGFYDRYQAAHPHHTTMAVAFEFQIMDEVPYEETDICPMYIITESRVID